MSFLLSNVGVVEDFPAPAGTRVVTSRFGTTARGYVPAVFASTTQGRLNLDLVYDRRFHCAEQIEEVAVHVETSLASGDLRRRSLAAAGFAGSAWR
jgi:hypothetical protein